MQRRLVKSTKATSSFPAAGQSIFHTSAEVKNLPYLKTVSQKNAWLAIGQGIQRVYIFLKFYKRRSSFLAQLNFILEQMKENWNAIKRCTDGKGL